jgi:phosphatidylglycerophosphate synthase
VVGVVQVTSSVASTDARPPTRRLGPGDRVTLARALLVVVLALLVVSGRVRDQDLTALVVALAFVALALDAVDGWVARQTGTVSAFGARFDMEVDAALLLVLCVHLAPSTPWWVGLIGAARYLYAGCGFLWPWLTDPVPPRRWRKAVAAVQGIALTVVAAAVLPSWVAELMLGVALAMLGASFGTQAWYVWRHRDRSSATTSPRARTVLALALVWVALLLPDDLSRLSSAAFLRFPVEGVVLLALALLLPARARTAAAVVAGLLLAAVTITTLLDLGFEEALGRPFDPLQDVGYLDSAFGLLRDSVGAAGAVVVSAVAVVLLLGMLVLLPLAVVHLADRVDAAGARWRRVVPALVMAWVVLAVLGAPSLASAPVASANVVATAREQVRQVRAGVDDRRQFGAALAADPWSDTSGSQLLTGLRGKDVLVVFVESYGRVAVEGSAIAPGIDRFLDQGTTRLRAAGFSARSAYLTSPTFGGISWLAHSTLQSGLWVDSQRRYDTLVAGERFTLSQAFHRAGWRTVALVPSNTENWPQGKAFYGYDTVYDARSVGYAGPSYSYATMPDQYVLAALQRLELGRTDRPPVMAEVDLVSSHTPWAPLPTFVPWERVGDGSVFAGQPEAGRSPQEVWRNPDDVRAAYARSIEYSLDALVSFVETYGDDDLVLLVVGDHQPSTIVSGRGASHDVPVSLVASDPAVLERADSWHWDEGLRPLPTAPVWRMDTVRDRFLEAYGAGG